MTRQEQKNLATDFEDEFDAVDPQQSSEPDAAKDIDGIPYCRTHHCRMIRNSGGKKGSPTTYYKCPVNDCDATAQIIKTQRESVVPTEPIACPRCSSKDKKVICSRDQRLSNTAFVVVKCPKCNWKSNTLAVPNFALQRFAGRRSSRVSEGIGDR